MDALGYVVLGAAAVAAGAVNSVAGGGSLLSFPAAVFFGLPPLVANATNAVGLTPGVLGSGFAYRRELAQDRAVLTLLAPPALLGGVCGAALLLVTPQALFEAVVPFLVLFATLLLLYQNLRRARPRGEADEGAWSLPRSTGLVRVLQFFVGLYGGYFGAGIGIMMLAMFGLLGGREIHRMNGVKVLLSAGINGFASLLFLAAGTVDLRAALVLAAGSTVGGLLGARTAKRTDPRVVRWVVVAIGLVLSAVFGYRQWFGGAA